MKTEHSDADHHAQNSFIASNESRLILFLFGMVVRWLFRFRFASVTIKQQYSPTLEDRTIYYLNHTSWWDGILPLLLNQTRFHQKARAVMELKQMREYGVFKFIGAFSIDLATTKSVIRSMRYALESMKREKASLFIYPEGKINAPADDLPKFEAGIGWLIRKCIEEGVTVRIVPIAVYTHLMSSSKPHLWVDVGTPVEGIEAILEKNQKEETALQDLNNRIAAHLHRYLTDQLVALKQEAYATAFPSITDPEQIQQ